VACSTGDENGSPSGRGGAGAGGGAGSTGGAGTAGTRSAGSSGRGGGGNAGSSAAGSSGAGGASAGASGHGGSGGAGDAGASGRGGDSGTTGSAGRGGAAGDGNGGGGAGGAGRGGTTGSAGRGGTNGGAGRGGATGGVGGAAGSSGAGGGAGLGGSAGGAGGSANGPFVCNQVTGGKLTYEWFAAGFENVVDNRRWQAKWREDAYVEVWADAQSSFWSAQVDSTCASGTTTPDRLVFGTVSFKYKTQAEWRTNITLAINNFKARWPTVRRIDLVTQIRGPNNMLCPTPPLAGETIAVPPEQDAAMADVAAAFPGFVFVGPKVQAHSCSEFVGGGPHLTTAGNMANVSVFSDYFVQVQ
jgi:hypothetical protein